MLKKIKSFLGDKQKSFILLAIIMFLCVTAVFVFLVIDLGVNINESVKYSGGLGVEKGKKLEFDIQGFKNLNLER